MAVRRLFFALWPSLVLAGRLHDVATALHRSCRGRLMRRDTLHVTLAFLGAVDETRVADVMSVADAVRAAPFAFELDRLGYWQHNRVVWTGCKETPAALAALADRLAQGLRGAGFALDAQPHFAHVTLLRKAHAGPDTPTLVPPIAWLADDFALIESHLTAQGSHYQVLRRWPLLID